MAASSILRDLGSSNGPCSSEKDNPFQSLDRKTTEEKWKKCCFYLMGRNNILNEEMLLFERMFRERYTEDLLARLKDTLGLETSINYTEEIKGILSYFDSEKPFPEPSSMEEGDRGDSELDSSGFFLSLPATSPGVAPVLCLINRRLRTLRKKLTRLLAMETRALLHGQKLNKDQEVLLQSKPTISAQINLLEGLREPLASALSEELSLFILADIATLEKAIKEKELRAHKDSKLTEEQWKILYSKCWKENVTWRDKLDMIELEYKICNIDSYLAALKVGLEESGVLDNLDKDEDEEDSVFDEQNKEVIGDFYDTEGRVINKDWETNFKILRRETRRYKAEVELLGEQLETFKKIGVAVPSHAPVCKKRLEIPLEAGIVLE